MRLPRVRLTWWSVLIALVIASDLLALWVWAARPPRVYTGWLGLYGPPEDAPFPRLLAWGRWEDGPRTPSGCLVLFELQELVLAGMLLFPLLLLIALPAAKRRGSRLGQWLTSPVHALRRPSVKFRVTTALAAVAILGLDLGWEINGWRAWRLRRSYLGRAMVEAANENQSRTSLDSHRGRLAFEKSDLFPLAVAAVSFADQGYYRSKAALAAENAESLDRLKQEISYYSAMVAAHAARGRKYERAAADPWKAVAPDPPLPEPEFASRSWPPNGEPERDLAACDEMSRVYPDLVEAHLSRAWIMATCPDDRFRDGPLAVRSATRACELTRWLDTEALATLAAACAETGDYEGAVKWQQKGLGLITDKSSTARLQEQLTFYKAGKPYRQSSSWYNHAR